MSITLFLKRIVKNVLLCLQLYIKNAFALQTHQQHSFLCLIPIIQCCCSLKVEVQPPTLRAQELSCVPQHIFEQIQFQAAQVSFGKGKRLNIYRTLQTVLMSILCVHSFSIPFHQQINVMSIIDEPTENVASKFMSNFSSPIFYF